MSVVVIRYINESLGRSFIIPISAEYDTSTLHRTFEGYLVEGWTTEILAYHPRLDTSDYNYWTELERREYDAHGEYQWDS